MDKDTIRATVGKRVARAMSEPEIDWRTVGGVARETGLPVGDVSEYIQQHPDDFRQSIIKPGGVPLYRIRRKACQAIVG